MRIFDFDGPVIQAVNWIGNTILLNLCFIICCLPVFTIGASVTALYSVYLLENDETWAILRFFRAFKSNFRQSTVLFLLAFAALFVLLLNYYALGNFDVAGSGFVYVFLYIATFLLLSVAIFSFALLAKFNNTVKQTVKNAAIITAGMILPALVIVLLSILPLVLLMIDAELFLHSVLFWILAGFAVCAKVNSLMIKWIFQKILSEQKS